MMLNWISVDDRIPELEKPVLLFSETKDTFTGFLRKTSEDDIHFCIGNEYTSWDYMFNPDIGTITHWMPLPEPPL